MRNEDEGENYEDDDLGDVWWHKPVNTIPKVWFGLDYDMRINMIMIWESTMRVKIMKMMTKVMYDGTLRVEPSHWQPVNTIPI